MFRNKPLNKPQASQSWRVVINMQAILGEHSWCGLHILLILLSILITLYFRILRPIQKCHPSLIWRDHEIQHHLSRESCNTQWTWMYRVEWKTEGLSSDFDVACAVRWNLGRGMYTQYSGQDHEHAEGFRGKSINLPKPQFTHMHMAMLMLTLPIFCSYYEHHNKYPIIVIMCHQVYVPH